MNLAGLVEAMSATQTLSNAIHEEKSDDTVKQLALATVTMLINAVGDDRLRRLRAIASNEHEA